GDARHYDLECTLTDRRRSVSFDAYKPLLGVAGARFISLQVGPTSAQARDYPAIIDLTSKIRDFADTAGLVPHLDLVISVDTAVAHLAGAMGKPVWILSRHDNCWRWMAEREDSPWYPNLRLYRQARSGDWPAVISRVAADLAQWTSGHKRGNG